MELGKGIHQIEGVRVANSYLVVDDEGAAVIDTGMPGNEKRIVEYARGVGIEPNRISYIFLTHADIDHSGSVSKLKDLTNAKVAIHGADAPRVSGEKKLKEVKGVTGAISGVMPHLMRFTPFQPDVLLRDSDRIMGLSVVHTPGHTDGSVSLYKEKEVIFVGDALRTDSAGKPHLPSGAMTIDIERAKESVKRISLLEYSMLLPGHGPPILKDASTAVSNLVQRGFT